MIWDVPEEENCGSSPIIRAWLLILIADTPCVDSGISEAFHSHVQHSKACTPMELRRKTFESGKRKNGFGNITRTLSRTRGHKKLKTRGVHMVKECCNHVLHTFHKQCTFNRQNFHLLTLKQVNLEVRQSISVTWHVTRKSQD